MFSEIKSKIFKQYAESDAQNTMDMAEAIANMPNPNFKVPYTTILDIQPHGNAERLEVATVYGFQVVIPKGRYVVGQKIVYIPIDSVLSPAVEALIFPADAKIKLHNSRVRQIRIRGFASQGMIVHPDDLKTIINLEKFDLEYDLQSILKVRKYEPPAPREKGPAGIPGGRKKKGENPLFHKYNGLDNIKWFPNKFQDGQEVVIQEKLHGTNARASRLPYNANSFKKKLMKLLRLAPAYENCYGSNNVEISSKPSYNGFYEGDIYGQTFEAINVFDKLKLGETVFGEIIGPSIQKNYNYGLTEKKFVLFDVKVLEADGKQRWLGPEEVEAFAKERGFEMVPVLYKGPFNKEYAYTLTKGDSVYCPLQKVREGIVIKARNEYSVDGNKQALKWISEAYLDDQSNTDFH